MYLTRCGINRARRGTRRLLASPQRVHAAVMAAFPPSDTSDRVLWRIDTRDHRTDLLVVSCHRPDLTHLVEQAGWPTTQTWETREYSPFLDRLATGQRWAFRLTANPVRNLPSDEGRGQVKAHVTAAQQQEWFLRRTSQLGIQVPTSSLGVPEMVVRDRRTARFERREEAAGREVTVAMATFDGLLDVVAPDLLRQALTAGIGRAKAYGCGLLTLARP